MRRLYPTPRDEALADLYLDLDWPPAPDDRPYLYLDMVSSIDGAATAEGRTADLGGEADELAFSRLREWCDAILVGAGTVRVEGYGPPRPSEDAQLRRSARGLTPVPTMIVITARCDLDPASRLFEDPQRRPTILTVDDADPQRRAALEVVADVIAVGRGRVDLRAGLRALRTRGVARLLGEGGPTLNGTLFAADLVDELFLTIAATIVGQVAPRIVAGEIGGAPRPATLVELREHEDELLARYRVGQATRAAG
jgi:riboflavin-specific deaminase-like protein